MKRIIFINRFYSPDYSATSQMLTTVAEGLAARDNDISVVTSRLCYDDPEKRLKKRERINRVDVIRIWTTRFGRASLIGRLSDYLSFYLCLAVYLIVYVKRSDLVVVKTDPPLMSVIVWGISKLKRFHYINWLQDLFPEVASVSGFLKKDSVIFKLLLTLRNLSLRSASHNVILGTRMAARLVNNSIDPEKLVIIENSAGSRDIVPISNENNTLRAAWGLSGKFVVGYSGNFGRVHEFDTFIKTARKLQDLDNVVFLFVGAGARYEQLQSSIEFDGIRNIVLKPYQNQDVLPILLAVPDVHLVSLIPAMEGYVVPSKFYGIAAAGRPMIFVGDGKGEIAKNIDSCDCGRQVDCGDVFALERLIREWIDQPKELARLGENARACYVDHYSHEHILRLWADLVNKI